MKKIFKCSTEQDTCRLAQAFAEIAKKGDVFALYGTLGVGKSTFSRHFILSLCDVTDVPSPTFTLLQTYASPNYEIYHYDMYRIKNPEEAYELDIEEAFYNGVCLIEWPEKIKNLLPRNHWKILVTVKDNDRFFEISTNDLDKISRLEKIVYA